MVDGNDVHGRTLLETLDADSRVAEGGRDGVDGDGVEGVGGVLSQRSALKFRGERGKAGTYGRNVADHRKLAVGDLEGFHVHCEGRGVVN